MIGPQFASEIAETLTSFIIGVAIAAGFVGAIFGATMVYWWLA